MGSVFVKKKDLGSFFIRKPFGLPLSSIWTMIRVGRDLDHRWFPQVAWTGNGLCLLTSATPGQIWGKRPTNQKKKPTSKSTGEETRTAAGFQHLAIVTGRADTREREGRKDSARRSRPVDFAFRSEKQAAAAANEAADGGFGMAALLQGCSGVRWLPFETAVQEQSKCLPKA